jgi:hypothetical protein
MYVTVVVLFGHGSGMRAEGNVQTLTPRLAARTAKGHGLFQLALPNRGNGTHTTRPSSPRYPNFVHF